MSITASLGQEGEYIAAQYLIKKGYEVLEQNYRHKHAEIDIVAKKKGILVFIEVKTRTGIRFGFPEEAVNSKKARKIVEGAEGYIYEKNWAGDVRFDIVAILKGPTVEIKHFKDAFY